MSVPVRQCWTARTTRPGPSHMTHWAALVYTPGSNSVSDSALKTSIGQLSAFFHKVLVENHHCDDFLYSCSLMSMRVYISEFHLDRRKKILIEIKEKSFILHHSLLIVFSFWNWFSYFIIGLKNLFFRVPFLNCKYTALKANVYWPVSNVSLKRFVFSVNEITGQK